MPKDICEKCSDPKTVVFWCLPSAGIQWPLCQSCLDDKEGFRQWLSDLMEEALEDDDDFERLPNGNYRRVLDADILTSRSEEKKNND